MAEMDWNDVEEVMEDQRPVAFSWVAVATAPAFLYASDVCRFFSPCVMSSENSRHAVMPVCHVNLDIIIFYSVTHLLVDMG